jgi:hypothetical protein
MRVVCVLKVHIRCIFQGTLQNTLRRHRVATHCLDVAALCQRRIAVPQNGLNDAVIDSKPVEVGSQSTPESMPTVRGQTRLDEDGQN